jgi:hypothetical protein
MIRVPLKNGKPVFFDVSSIALGEVFASSLTGSRALEASVRILRRIETLDAVKLRPTIPLDGDRRNAPVGFSPTKNAA